MLTKRYSPVTVLLTFTLFSAWPHWYWLAKRLIDGSDEPWGLLALATLLAFAGRDRQHWSPPGLLTLNLTVAFLLSASYYGRYPPHFSPPLADSAVVSLESGYCPDTIPSLFC